MDRLVNTDLQEYKSHLSRAKKRKIGRLKRVALSNIYRNCEVTTDRLSLHGRGRRVNSNTWMVDSQDIRSVSIPKLKPSVSQWIAKLISQVQNETMPGVVVKFLAFVEEEMMQPERVQRADCPRVLEFFHEYMDKVVQSKEPSS
ncbi:uncharacterized protein FMAN_02221 [Fusarium mangiferae]|uniref:Uncharacterized protein n=1 Tax=Fusarium mangiferae TaxID=192010 RepID=A0A1L7TN85_FUSMA|nr:uncharacterized protein FMAN_02221 [Fusarium mangiferae]CVK99379.1 uncharacterized protein FMAN_02221 [Fusarium mangiferae]